MKKIIPTLKAKYLTEKDSNLPKKVGMKDTPNPLKLADEEGFEPPEGANLQRFSRPPHSTTLPLIHIFSDFSI